MKILILRFSSIGDVVLTTPIVRCLKLQYPDAQIHYATKPAFAGFLKNNPHIDHLLILDGSLKKLIREINQNSYDHVLDLHNNLRTLLIKSSLPQSAVIKSFPKLNWKKLLSVKFKRVNALPAIHIVDRYFKAASKLKLKSDGKGLDFFFPDRFEVPQVPTGFDSYLALVIGGQFATKQLPPEKLIQICQNIKDPIILIGGKEDAPIGAAIQQACSHTFNACGLYDLNASAYLVKMAKVVITHDTGLMHIAAAFQKPIVSIWGNTIPEFGMYPYLPQQKAQYSIHEVKGLNCRPCSKIGYHKCPKGHFNCMQLQNSEAIAQDAIKRFEA